jgi:ubiquinone biosynthesis protein
VGVFAKHGFHNVAERVRLGKFLVERLSAKDGIEKLTAAERVRLSFEELGPTFVKLGQVLASRPDLIPADYVQEFERLHDRVQPLPFETVRAVLEEEFGDRLDDLFASIDSAPLGSASIAQVHAAKLRTGEDVVIKVQRPGIVQTISDDLSVLYMLAELLARYIPETRIYRPVSIVDEFFKTLEFETNFIVEANNLRRFAANFPGEKDPRIPKVHLELTTERVLVMEALKGIPLSQDEALRQPDIDPREVIRCGLRAYLKMVFIDGLFHGDLHAGNFFVYPGNQIGLIDFGVVGRLNPKTQTAIANMLLALSKEDYERLALEYVDLAPFTDRVNLDLFARELRELIAPFYGLTLRNVNLGKLLMSSGSIAARHHLTVPTELMMFFKSIVAIEGLGRRIDRDFDFLSASLEFAGDLAKFQLDPNRMVHDMSEVARESRNFIASLPRQLSFFLRKINSPDHAIRLNIRGLDELRRAVEITRNLLFLGLIIGSLILSASIVFTMPGEPHRLWGLPTVSFVLYLLAAVLSVAAFFNYIRRP